MVELGEVCISFFKVTQEYPSDQVTRYDEKDIDTEKPSRDSRPSIQFECGVIEDNPAHGDGAQPVDFWTVTRCQWLAQCFALLLLLLIRHSGLSGLL